MWQNLASCGRLQQVDASRVRRYLYQVRKYLKNTKIKQDIVVFRFESVQEYYNSFPKLIRGEPVKSLSGIGTNNDNPNPKVPKVLFVGGGFSEEELSEMRNTDEAKSLPWVNPGPRTREEVQKVGNLMSKEQRDGGPGPDVMEVVTRRVKECLKAHGVTDDEGDLSKEGGQLWYC